MPIFFQKQTHHSIVTVWHITESLSTISSLCRNKEDIAVLNKSNKRIREQLIENLLLEKLLGKINWDHNSDGKPFVKDSQIKISISHTCDYLAVQVSPQKEVGIDIEGFHNKILHLEKRFILNDDNIPETTLSKLQLLTLIWCAKEAGFKQFSSYGAKVITDIQILEIDESKHHIKVRNKKATSCNISYFEYQLFNEFMLLYSL